MFDSVIATLNSHYLLDTMFDGVNLRAIHYLANLIGAGLALYVMQLWTVGSLSTLNDCWLSRQIRRLALWLLILAMLWSLGYSDAKDWSPWPSDVACILAVDLFLISSILVAVKRKRLLG